MLIIYPSVGAGDVTGVSIFILGFCKRVFTYGEYPSTKIKPRFLGMFTEETYLWRHPLALGHIPVDPLDKALR
jgi:hypothetical protein